MPSFPHHQIQDHPRCHLSYLVAEKTSKKIIFQSLARIKALRIANQSSSSKYHKEVCVTMRGSDKSEFIQLRKLLERSTDITKLSLSFQECANLKDKDFMQIFEQIKRMSLLKRLALDFSNCQELTDRGIESLARCLKICRNLEYFEYQFPECWSLRDRGLLILGDFLKRLKKLKYLRVNKSRPFEITEKGFGIFLQDLRNLKGLALDFVECSSFSSERFEQIMKGLAKLDTLERLTLHCESCPDLYIDEFLCCLEDNINQLKSLSYLKVTFAHMPKLSWSLGSRKKSIVPLEKRLTTLKSLSLNFMFCGTLTDDLFRNVGKFLQVFPGLEQLNMKISK